MKYHFVTHPEFPDKVFWANPDGQIMCGIERSTLLIAIHGIRGVVEDVQLRGRL